VKYRKASDVAWFVGVSVAHVLQDSAGCRAIFLQKSLPLFPHRAET
jgi:hypothetical protein